MIYEIKVRLNKKEILRYLGYREGINIPKSLDDLINNSIVKAYDLLEPRGTYKTLDINDIKNDIVILNQNKIIKSEDITNLIKNSEKATIMAITVGEKLQYHIDELFKKGEYTEALIFDSIGSDGAENATEYLNKIIEKEAREENYFLTNRFSPGYGDFNLSYQKIILQELKAENIGLNVTESSILVPRKSVTAIIGWTKEKAPPKFLNKCQNCNANGCNYRNDKNCNVSNKIKDVKL